MKTPQNDLKIDLRSLADIIKEKKTEIETTYTDAGSLQRRELDPDIVELCQGIGQVLKKYRQVTLCAFLYLITLISH